VAAEVPVVTAEAPVVAAEAAPVVEPSAPSVAPVAEAPTPAPVLTSSAMAAARDAGLTVEEMGDEAKVDQAQQGWIKVPGSPWQQASEQLHSELSDRIDARSDKGQDVGAHMQALDRLERQLARVPKAPTSATATDSPMSRWASVMEDDGRGYNYLSPEGQQEWANAQPTRAEAERIAEENPSAETAKTLRFINDLQEKLDSGNLDPERVGKILDTLERAAKSDNPFVAAAAKRVGNFSLATWNTLTGTRNLDGSAVRPMAPGRARMLVQTFLSKLATKPKVTVVANQRELQRTNPALYAQANAARPQGDFATAAAAGYSFGDGNVIIFTDRIANEQHLRFVLAHEIFGHFGMRGVMPGDRFDALMGSIYDTDPQAKAAADAAMEARGLSKPEAVEEYLSDYAALLNTSTVARVWNAIKNILSKLGVRFGDIATRYFLDQSRRYVREGRQGVAFDAEAVAQRLHAVEAGSAGTGRYSPEAAFSVSSRAQVMIDGLATGYKSLDDVMANIVRAGKGFRGQFDRFKADVLSLFNFRAMDNPWLFELNKLIGLMNTTAMSVKTNINEFLRPLYNMDAASQVRISQLMYDVRQMKDAEFNSRKLPKGKLYQVDNEGNLVPNKPLEEKLFQEGLLTLEQIRDGVTYKYTIEGTDGKPQTIERKIEGRPKFTEEEYAAYVRTRRAVANVELEVLRALYSDLLQNRTVTNREVSRLIKGKKGILDTKDKAFVREYADMFQAFYTQNAEVDASGVYVLDTASTQKARKFLEAVNAAFIWRDTKNLDPAREEAVRAFFPEKTQADDFVAKLNDTRSRRDKISDANRLNLQTAVEQLVLNEIDYGRKEARIKENIATGYIPVYREGMYQMRLRAFINGQPVDVKHTHKDLLAYSQFDNPQDALDMATAFNNDLKDKTFTLLVRDSAGNYSPKEVTLVADTGTVITNAMTEPGFDLDNFLYGMQILGQKLDPKVMERLIIRTTNHNNARRGRLKFSQTPGYDNTQGIVAISRHIEKQASAVARAITRQSVREMMDLGNENSRAMLDGDKANVARLRAEYDRINADPTSTADAKADIRSRYTFAAAMDRKTNPQGQPSKANQYYNEGAKAIDFLDGSKFVDESNFGAGPIASRVRAYTSMMQLGGSIAQGVLNLLSIETNWKPYMASFNQRNGFGAGFNYFTVTAEYNRAFMKIGAPGMTNFAMNEANFYDAGAEPTDKTLLKDWKPGIAQSKALQTKYGMTAEEARVIAREIREGKLIPAQSNAMTATARGYSTNKWALKFMDTWMAPFNLSEQAARRAAFLSAYRLFYNRGIGAGMDAKKASERAREEAVRSLDLTLGEYSMMNRPAFWRGGMQSFLYMYKTYPTTVVQLLARLDRPAQLSALAGLWLLAGMSGLPFAEDLEDLIDTLSQKLGLGQGSIRAELIRHIESIAPGMSAPLLRGLMNEIGLADVASRTGVGNLLPGTDMFLAGADQTRAMMDILGPAAGFLGGALGMATNLVSYPFSSTKTLEDIARESPITFLRLMGDSYAYASSGAVVDRRGYVVSPDMDAGTIITRMMGFYPQAAAAQYDVIRITQREADYQKQMTAAFRQAWIKASLRGDSDRASEIMDAVRSWHDSNRGTALDIQPGRFMMGNVRALREAQLAAGDRTLRASPQAAQESIRDLMDALTD